ncbi:uncharacterized protein LOC110228864 [Arabidopsis lyrata subsp. lyrata]|uniref:uncharacterized protein LOC110228864 n=1 Tax=Arabidopsis lyrata subsp. lyrata TaxID=81972 RepID=UPI000A29B446|nr:uncharacterized protein LOC110228864 [Arabidopsis lyrata subsp. lyrata]|eukprot:XP_020882738.1 uncharacterized protein LOC110228864 [Arabidopsis lyrata subsp. lyrata]
MTSDPERPESPSFDDRRPSNDECTRPNDIAGPHYRSTCTLQSLERLRELCWIPPEIMAEAQIAAPTESPENHRDGYFCVYEIYFKGCGLTFPLPEALVRYLAVLEIALPQLTPNLLRTILGIITVAAKAGYIIGVPELNELLSVRSSSKKTGLTPRRERHDDRPPRRLQSPNRDSHRSSRDDFSNEPLKDLIRKKRDRSSRSGSSPRREKSRARTDRSPRSSLPTEPMGLPRPVDMSSSSQRSGEKTNLGAASQKDTMEKEGNVFRCFKTRSGAILPEFNKWRSAIRERYLLHAHHSSRDKFSNLEVDLRSSTDSKHDLEDKVDGLSSELAKIKGELQDQYDQNFKLQGELSGVQGRLHESESTADTLNNQLIELNAKYKVITKLRDSELARSASKARKEVKGRGMELIQGAIHFMQTEKARSDLESDIKEHESDLILLDQIHETDFSEEQERIELSTNLSEKRSRLTALPTSTFNPHDFEEFFTESPPISESGLDWAGNAWLLTLTTLFLPYVFF